MRHQKSALFGSEIRPERYISIIFGTNRHKIDITTGRGVKGLNTSIQEKTMENRILHRNLISSFAYSYNRQVLLLMICMYA